MLEQYFGKPSRKDINPDEAVAFGAAVQGGIMSGDAGPTPWVLIDVNPLTLGRSSPTAFRRSNPLILLQASRRPAES